MITCGPTIPSPVHEECRNSFKKLGVVKVHWECWSNCNLKCGFCFRTKGAPLETEDAKRLLSAVSWSGAETIVFAGGDPTLRKDLPDLTKYAKAIGLKVEVQTNAHFVPLHIKELLLSEKVDLLGLSLDGSTPMTHDSLRSTRGNFDRVLSLLNIFARENKPVIVRTLVNSQNQNELFNIGQILSKYKNVVRWSLLEFTPMGEGYINSKRYALDHELFSEVAERAADQFEGFAHVDIYKNELKRGTYMLLTPDGNLYSTSDSQNGAYPVIGNILDMHLSSLAKSFSFDREKHAYRYGVA